MSAVSVNSHLKRQRLAEAASSVAGKARSHPHLTAGLGSLALAIGLWLLTDLSSELWRDKSYGRKADSLVWRTSVASGTTAMLLLALTLVIGPFRRLTGHRPQLHLRWRRATGVWASVWAGVHVAFAITVHNPGWKLWQQFTYIRSSGLLLVMSLASWAGLGALLLLVPVAATSNTTSMRRLGASRWKLTQRLSYGTGLLALVHVVGFQFQEQRTFVHVAITTSVLIVVAMTRLADVGNMVLARGGRGSVAGRSD